MLAKLLKLKLNLICDGLNLARIGAAANYEVIGEGGDFAHIEGYDIARLLGFGGSGGGEPELLGCLELLGLAQVIFS